ALALCIALLGLRWNHGADRFTTWRRAVLEACVPVGLFFLVAGVGTRAAVVSGTFFIPATLNRPDQSLFWGTGLVAVVIGRHARLPLAMFAFPYPDRVPGTPAAGPALKGAWPVVWMHEAAAPGNSHRLQAHCA
ncbi:MAG: hypothetical protein QGG40_20705, partial [Myxococcota bacterium]|nr:hypothetical protein [Myxococcota bacterium]